MSDWTDSGENYVRWGLDRFAGFGDAEAFVATDGRRFTYADLRARIRHTAAALWGHGIRPGMTIALLVTNSAEAFFVQLGAHLLGCRTVFGMRVAPRVFLDGLLAHVHADAFVYQLEVAGPVGRELALAAGPLPILCIGAGGLGPDLTDPPPVAELPFDLDEIGHEPVSLFQTSGTTGTPKLVRHGNRFFRGITKVADFYRPDDGRPIRHLSYSGAWHAAGQSAALMTWFSGGTLVTRATWDVESYLKILPAEQINSSLLAAAALSAVLDDPRLADTDLSSLHSLTIGTSPASPARLSEAVERFGPVVNVVYGMSEITIITALTDLPANRHRLASCGRPWGDARVEIRDTAGAPLPADQVGEIWVAGELVTEEYWGMPALTAERIVDGWLHTGDVGRLDPDGYLSIVDRSNDMIVTGLAGVNIYCRPIEDALAEHSQVRQAAVIGVPDAVLGEVVHAFVLRTPGGTVPADELRELVAKVLNADWAPQTLEFIDAFPTTEMGKVDKVALRARYLAGTR